MINFKEQELKTTKREGAVNPNIFSKIQIYFSTMTTLIVFLCLKLLHKVPFLSLGTLYKITLGNISASFNWGNPVDSNTLFFKLKNLTHCKKALVLQNLFPLSIEDERYDYPHENWRKFRIFFVKFHEE